MYNYLQGSFRRLKFSQHSCRKEWCQEDLQCRRIIMNVHTQIRHVYESIGSDLIYLYLLLKVKQTASLLPRTLADPDVHGLFVYKT